MLIVAQRVSTILHADMIIVLDDGRVVGDGAPRGAHGFVPGVPGDRHLPARRGGRVSTRRRRGGPGGCGAGRRAQGCRCRSNGRRSSARRSGVSASGLRPERVRIAFVVLMASASVSLHRVRPEDPRQCDRRPVQRGRGQAAACRDDQAAGDRALATARREGQLADMIRGMNLIPGVGVDFGAPREAARPGSTRLRLRRRAQLGPGLRAGRSCPAHRVPHATRTSSPSSRGFRCGTSTGIRTGTS